MVICIKAHFLGYLPILQSLRKIENAIFEETFSNALEGFSISRIKRLGLLGHPLTAPPDGCR